MRLTPDEISQYAANAGFIGEDLRTAVAIAMAESGGETTALGDTEITPGGSLGLWQINLRWHPEFSLNPNELYDPAVNAIAAYKVFGRQGFTAWSTYKDGAYQKYLPTQEGPQTFLDESD